MFSKLPPPIRSLVVLIIIVSGITGGLVGAVFGVVASGVAGENLWPFVAQSLGISAPDGVMGGGGRGEPQVVVEDSATVDVVAQATRAVVSIVVTQDLSKLYNQTGPGSPFGDPFFFSFPFGFQTPPSGKQEVGGGTGFIITTDGLIVTNRHVVDQAEAEYTVITNDGTQYEAEVLARDTVNDVAILKIQADNLPVLDLGDSESVKIGQTVIAIGNSLGEFSNTVTKGVVSGINRRVVAGNSRGSSEVIEEAIQTDAAINPGNSGGPLLDLFGKVIGVNTAVSQEGQLIGFAIPINEVKSAIASVREFGRIVRPFLGVRYVIISPEFAEANNIAGVDHGALIVRGDSRTDLAVIPGSPADKAGLVENDIILEVNGEKVTQERGLAKILSRYKPSDTVTLKVFRKSEEIEVSATLVEQQ
ncbi:MAG: trypsin-like peptidase domain-containing protein [Parcubacteria group bacterium]|nr:trypsin-like peptidase domain-containing protein [Parcubacteria group bacterium]